MQLVVNAFVLSYISLLTLQAASWSFTAVVWFGYAGFKSSLFIDLCTVLVTKYLFSFYVVFPLLLTYFVYSRVLQSVIGRFLLVLSIITSLEVLSSHVRVKGLKVESLFYLKAVCHVSDWLQ